MAGPAAFRIVQRNALVYRRVWRGSLFFNFLQPSLFLLAMGVGVGRLIGPGAFTFPGGVSFLSFLGPGLLASTCMQTATFESSFPIVGKMTWRRNYEAICATPVRVIDVVLGELAARDLDELLPQLLLVRRLACPTLETPLGRRCGRLPVLQTHDSSGDGTPGRGYPTKPRAT